MDIGPGDWVECINRVGRGPWRLTSNQGGVARLEVGRMYMVEGIVDDDGIIVSGVRSNHYSGCYHYSHFRPVYRPKAEIIEALKQPVPELEPHHA